MAVWSSYVAGPRWAGIREFLFDAAREAGVEIRFGDRDRGLLRETVWFEAEGTREGLDLMQAIVAESVALYERRTR